MRKAILFFTLASITLIAAATLPMPAAATDARQAIALCDNRGSDCKMNTDKETGNTTLCVNNSGKTECVQCPLQGNCVVAKKSGSKGKIGPVNGVLSGAGSIKAPKGKKPVIGGVTPPKSGGVKSAADGQSEKHRINTPQHSSSSGHK